MDYIISIQTEDGCYGPKEPTGVWSYMYNHAVCALAMAEAAGMCRESKYRQSADKAIDFILKARNNLGIWGYNPKDPRYDSSVTGWMAMAVKSAKLSGIDVPDQVFKDIRRHTFESNGGKEENSGDSLAGDPELNYANAAPMTNRKGPAMCAIGMLLRMYTGSKGSSHGVRLGADKMLGILPKWNAGGNGIPGVNAKFDFAGWNQEYTWYYGTLTMFQVGGDHWKTWNKALVECLVPNQRKGGPLDGSLQDVDGSWDTVSGGWSDITGRAYMTAMCALNLEIYYRYQSIFKH